VSREFPTLMPTPRLSEPEAANWARYPWKPVCDRSRCNGCNTAAFQKSPESPRLYPDSLLHFRQRREGSDPQLRN
jgi:hypothetical protein